MDEGLCISYESLEEMRSILLMENDDPNWYAIVDFWHSPQLLQWFHDRGYTLYTRMYSNGFPSRTTVPSLPFDEVGAGSYPYAHYDGGKLGGMTPLRTSDHSGKVIFAQDTRLRHVAIKLVFGDSDEYRILRFLHEQGTEILEENCVVPVLDLLTCGEFCFAVMPRWSGKVPRPEIHTLKEILPVMHSMLKGLAYLHSHNIIHRDIKMENVLMNHFADDFSIDFHPGRARLRKQGKALYALMDFNLSIMAPPDINRNQYRRSYRDSLDGTWPQPFDTAAGEFDYNPFAFDVACLGVVFCLRYQHYSRHLPMLAPLLDKMTTWQIDKRFTAAEALQFFETMRSDLTENQLSIKEYENPAGLVSYELYDRWQGVPAEFKQKWASYR